MRITDRPCRVYAAASFVRSQLSLAAMFIFTAVCMFLLGYLLDDTEENAPTTQEKHWALVWHDEFNGTEVDLQKWSFEYNCYGGGNNEQQCYTDRKENAFIAEGLLHIVARQEPFSGPAHKDDHRDYLRTDLSVTKPFTSARMRTLYKGDWLYGRFEVRAKLPSGQGSWAAAWMLPSDSCYGEWSSSGELDIVEAVNLGTLLNKDTGAKETRVHGTLHYGQSWPNNVYSGFSYQLPNNQSPADNFHVYAIEWQQDEIRWYVDGVHYATQTSKTWYSKYVAGSDLIEAKDGAPFDKRFHLLLNLAVGGDWAENVNDKGIDKRAFPQTFLIDYVRVYQSIASNDRQ